VIDKTCCGILEQLKEKYDLPFYRPISYTTKDRQLAVGSWAIRLLKTTPGGAIARGGQGTLFLNYCPICGARLAPEETAETGGETDA